MIAWCVHRHTHTPHSMFTDYLCNIYISRKKPWLIFFISLVALHNMNLSLFRSLGRMHDHLFLFCLFLLSICSLFYSYTLYVCMYVNFFFSRTFWFYLWSLTKWIFFIEYILIMYSWSQYLLFESNDALLSHSIALYFDLSSCIHTSV